MLQLQIEHAAVDLPSGELMLVGRGDRCDIQLQDPSASRVHCRLLAQDGKVFISDASSRWGTYVNGVRISECELMPGDEITIGETSLLLKAQGEAKSTTLVRPSQLARPPELGRQVTSVSNSDQIYLAEKKLMFSPLVAVSPIQPEDYLQQKFAGAIIDQLLKRTANGLVFRGQWQGKAAVIKLFQPVCWQEEVARERFRRACEIVSKLDHPRLVKVFDCGFENEIGYEISEFIEGETASDMIQRIGIAGMLDWRNTLKIAVDMAEALCYLEEEKIVHRNILPEHIYVCSQTGAASLHDFLIAKAIDDAGPQLTKSGQIVGSLPYLAPEQVSGSQLLDQRTDFYQLGSTLYALLTGRPPFAATNTGEMLEQILHQPPTPPTKFHLAIPALLEGVVLTMLQKRPQDRYVSAQALLNALERVSRFNAHSNLK